MNITKAIIPVAGNGTRFLPITKTINKSMLPVLNRPIIDYIVEDCVLAGIKDIYFVVLPGEKQLRDYYSPNKKLEKYLISRGAKDKLALIADIHKKANFHYIEQPQDGRYGTAIPPLLVQQYIERDENFVVSMGDDFVWRKDGGSEIADIIRTHQETNAECTMACHTVAKAEIQKYAAVNTLERNGHTFFVSMIEKPRLEQINTELANINKFVFNYDIFSYIAKVKPNEASGEFYLTDAVNMLAADGHETAVHNVKGEYLNCGELDGWLKANQVVAQSTRLGKI